MEVETTKVEASAGSPPPAATATAPANQIAFETPVPLKGGVVDAPGWGIFSGRTVKKS